MESVITAPAIQFKGTGWYVTDYGRKTTGGDSSKADKGENPRKAKNRKNQRDQRDQREIREVGEVGKGRKVRFQIFFIFQRTKKNRKYVQGKVKRRVFLSFRGFGPDFAGQIIGNEQSTC